MSGDGTKKPTRSSTRGKRDNKDDAKAEESSKKEDTASDTAAAATTTSKGKDKDTTTNSKKDTKKDSSKDTKAATKEDAATSKKEAALKKEEEPPASETAKKEASKDTEKAAEGDDKKAEKGETEKKDTASKDKAAASKTEEAADEEKDGKQEEGIDATTPSKEVIRTVYWPAAERRYDEITIEDDFEFDDETQTITGICEKPPRHFPNTHFMRRLAGHLRLGLGRNATKEAILEKICQAKYGAAFTRPPVEDETSSSKKRRASDAAGSSTVLKKRPVIMKSTGKRGSVANASSAVEATLKARAAALTAVSASLDTIATTIRQAEERLQKLCEAAKVDFYVALMDRSKLTNEYLRTHFAEYDDFLKTQKDMIASITELSKGNDLKGPINLPGVGTGSATTTPAGKAAGTPASGGVAAMTVGIAIPPSGSTPDPDEVTNHMEV